MRTHSALRISENLPFYSLLDLIVLKSHAFQTRLLVNAVENRDYNFDTVLKLEKGCLKINPFTDENISKIY